MSILPGTFIQLLANPDSPWPEYLAAIGGKLGVIAEVFETKFSGILYKIELLDRAKNLSGYRFYRGDFDVIPETPRVGAFYRVKVCPLGEGSVPNPKVQGEKVEVLGAWNTDPHFLRCRFEGVDFGVKSSELEPWVDREEKEKKKKETPMVLKKGDRVRIKKPANTQEGPAWTSMMDVLDGTIHELKDRSDCGSWWYIEEWFIHPNWLEKIEDEIQIGDWVCLKDPSEIPLLGWGSELLTKSVQVLDLGGRQGEAHLLTVHLNDVHPFWNVHKSEVEKTTPPTSPPVSVTVVSKTTPAFKVGDRVQVRKPDRTDVQDFSKPYWNPEMDIYDGKVLSVYKVGTGLFQSCLELESAVWKTPYLSTERFWQFHQDWLTKVTDEKVEEKKESMAEKQKSKYKVGDIVRVREPEDWKEGTEVNFTHSMLSLVGELCKITKIDDPVIDDTDEGPEEECVYDVTRIDPKTGEPTSSDQDDEDDVACADDFSFRESWLEPAKLPEQKVEEGKKEEKKESWKFQLGDVVRVIPGHSSRVPPAWQQPELDGVCARVEERSVRGGWWGDPSIHSYSLSPLPGQKDHGLLSVYVIHEDALEPAPTGVGSAVERKEISMTFKKGDLVALKPRSTRPKEWGSNAMGQVVDVLGSTVIVKTAPDVELTLDVNQIEKRDGARFKNLSIGDTIVVREHPIEGWPTELRDVREVSVKQLIDGYSPGVHIAHPKIGGLNWFVRIADLEKKSLAAAPAPKPAPVKVEAPKPVSTPKVETISTPKPTPVLVEAPKVKILKRVFVEEVGFGTPAASAGLKKGDVIVEFAEKPSEKIDVPLVMLERDAGEDLVVVVERNGKRERKVVNQLQDPKSGTWRSGAIFRLDEMAVEAKTAAKTWCQNHADREGQLSLLKGSYLCAECQSGTGEVVSTKPGLAKKLLVGAAKAPFKIGKAVALAPYRASKAVGAVVLTKKAAKIGAGSAVLGGVAFAITKYLGYTAIVGGLLQQFVQQLPLLK